MPYLIAAAAAVALLGALLLVRLRRRRRRGRLEIKQFQRARDVTNQWSAERAGSRPPAPGGDVADEPAR